MSENRMDKLTEIGCICCRKLGYKSPAEIHHIVRGMRRIGDDETIPLCAYHHRGVKPVPDMGRMALLTTENVFGPARHVVGRRAFEKRWGTEKELLIEVNDLLGESSCYCPAYDCFGVTPHEDEYCGECRNGLLEQQYDEAHGH